MTIRGIFDQFGAGGLQNAAGSGSALEGLMASQQSAFERQLVAAQGNDLRAQQMNAAMAQMVQHHMERDRNAALAQAFGNVGRDLYKEFTNRYVATPEAAKKCPPPRDPAKCPPPKPIKLPLFTYVEMPAFDRTPTSEYMDSIADWMPKPGDIVKGMTNRDKLRAEVAAWTRRVV